MRRQGPEPDGILHNHQGKQISWVPFGHNMLLHIQAPVSAKIHIFAAAISKNEYCKNIKNSVCYLFGTLKTWQFYKSTPDKSVNVRALRGCDFSVDRFAKTLSVDYDHPRFFRLGTSG